MVWSTFGTIGEITSGGFAVVRVKKTSKLAVDNKQELL